MILLEMKSQKDEEGSIVTGIFKMFNFDKEKNTKERERQKHGEERIQIDKERKVGLEIT